MKAYRTKIRYFEELRERIFNVWEDFDQLVIDAPIGQWRERFETVAKAEGGHFQHTL